MGGDDGAVEGLEGLGQGELILCADLWGFLRDEFGNVLGAPDQLGLPGWLDGEKVLGRPSAPLVKRDGSLLISDDQANVIYQITYIQ